MRFETATILMLLSIYGFSCVSSNDIMYAYTGKRSQPADVTETMDAENKDLKDDGVVLDCEIDVCKVGKTCSEHAYISCCGNAICWYDSCGRAREKICECPYGCAKGGICELHFY